jgi:hypothetical protein
MIIIIISYVIFLETSIPMSYLWLLCTVSQEEAYRLKEMIKQIMLNTECYVNMCPICDCCYGCSECMYEVVIMRSVRYNAYTARLLLLSFKCSIPRIHNQTKIGVQRIAVDVFVHSYLTSLARAAPPGICNAVNCARRHDSVLHWREQL